MNASAEPTNQTQFNVKITRKSLVIFTGAIMGFIWLLPVFGSPGSSLESSSPLRYLRLIAPVLILALVRRKDIANIFQDLSVQIPRGRLPRREIQILASMLVLGVIPLCSNLLTANIPFLISVTLPLTFSSITLLGMLLIDKETFHHWMLGMTGMTTLFLLAGMLLSGFETTMFFGRPRVVLNFIHPTYTASAILGTMVFLSLLCRIAVLRLSRSRQYLVIGSGLIIGLALLQVAQSRNQQLSLCIGLICAWLMVRVGWRVRYIIFALLLIFPVVLYTFVLLGSPNDYLWDAIDKISSGRLGFFQTVLLQNFDLSDGRILFEAGGARQEAISELSGFAATDSIFLSFLINYGLIAMLAFVSWLMLIGARLARDARFAAPLGAFCGLITLYSFDASGLTTSNLLLFSVLAYIVRTSLYSKSSSN